MVKYNCDRCLKEFSQKSHYDSHKKRKTPCDNNIDVIKQLVDKAVEEKLKELKNKKLIVNNKNNTSKNMTDCKIQKPFLKWVGGKNQLINDIISKIPSEMNNYHELFLGGGSVLLAILSLKKQEKIKIKNKIYAYDFNESLINTFNQIKNNKNDVIIELNKLKNEFTKIEKNTEGQRGKPSDINKNTYKNTREHYYYWIRDLYNTSSKNTVLSSAYFIFLNKTGFKGMYREGKKGFNIPYGQKDKKSIPSIFSEDDLKNISDLIKDVEFKYMSFKESIKNVKTGDFVYLDPPYAPENSNSFVNYVVDGFSLETHKLLFDEIKKIDKIKFIMSNANVELVTDNFKDYNCQEIMARRAINSKKPDSKTTEVIIYN
jgi:DNA adenine methylase